MDIYKYKALSPDGVEVKGVVEAYDEFEAAAQIKQECPIVLKLELVPGKKERIDLNEPLWVSEKVLAMVCSQFSILLKAGLPIVRTVELIADQTSDRLMKKILRQVAGDVSSGYGLAASFTLREENPGGVFGIRPRRRGGGHPGGHLRQAGGLL